MLFYIHATMQDADNFDLAFSYMTVKNYMFTNTVLEIAFSDVITSTANTWFISQVMKCAIKLRQITYLLNFSPLPVRITANGKQITLGFFA
jgi:hypothetical protein